MLLHAIVWNASPSAGLSTATTQRLLRTPGPPHRHTLEKSFTRGFQSANHPSTSANQNVTIHNCSARKPGEWPASALQKLKRSNGAKDWWSLRIKKVSEISDGTLVLMTKYIISCE